MSKGETLRALVTERLAAAAEDIFVLFEKTIAEYEEELCRSQRENQRKQRLLDAVLNPRVVLPRAGTSVQVHSPSPGPSLIHKTIVQIKEEPEEQRIKHEEEQLRMFDSETNTVCLKTEEGPQEENISSEQPFHSESEGDSDESSSTDSSDSSSDSDSDDDDDGGSCSDALEEGEVRCYGDQMEIEADGDHYNQHSGLLPDYKYTPETSDALNTRHTSGMKVKKYRCSVCAKRFRTLQGLGAHRKTHAKESCSICAKINHQQIFREKEPHNIHKPYSCPMCSKPFAQLGQLRSHLRVHTGDRPYSCSFCEKTFTQKYGLNAHMKLHTGEGPFSCSVCNKDFPVKWNLMVHMKTHEKRRQR